MLYSNHMDSPARKIAIEIVGWYGTVTILTAYVLLNFGYLQPTDVLYPFLNAIGALGLILVSLYKRTYQPGILNVIWIAVAIITLLQM